MQIPPVTEPYRIEGIALHEIGVFDDIRLDFPPISSPERDEKKAEVHVFTGPNGYGKSTLLYALAGIFRQPYTQGLIERRFRSPLSRVYFRFFSHSGVYAVSLPEHQHMGSSEFGGDWQVRYMSSDRGYVFGWRQGEINEQHDWQSFFAYQNAQSSYNVNQSNAVFVRNQAYYAAFAYSGQRTLSNIDLGAIQKITNSPFENALSFDATVRPRVLLQWVANNRTQSALAKADNDIADAERYDRALERITQAIKDNCDMEIEFRLERQPLGVTLRVGKDILAFDTLPDGLKSIISWIGDLSVRLEMHRGVLPSAQGKPHGPLPMAQRLLRLHS